MRKFLFGVLCILMLAGCQNSNQNTAVKGETSYEGFYKSIEDNEKFQSSSLYYEISAEMTTLADGTHRYYIFLDHAQIAMYDVVMLAVEDDIPYENATRMMPCIGVFETSDYSLIPFQSNAKAGFMKGLVISGACEGDSVQLKMLVEWSDKTRESKTREYLAFVLDENGLSAADSAKADGQEEVTANE
jgi:hypothetical protein